MAVLGQTYVYKSDNLNAYRVYKRMEGKIKRLVCPCHLNDKLVKPIKFIEELNVYLIRCEDSFSFADESDLRG